MTLVSLVTDEKTLKIPSHLRSMQFRKLAVAVFDVFRDVNVKKKLKHPLATAVSGYVVYTDSM